MLLHACYILIFVQNNSLSFTDSLSSRRAIKNFRYPYIINPDFAIILE